MFWFDFAQLQTVGLVALSGLLGAAIGLERELAHKPAGLRTHMLVASTGTLFVALGDIVIGHFQANLGSGLVRADPTRLIEAVITGITFLGAGTIIRLGGSRRIEGLTTAASILAAAAVGVCVALRQLFLAIGMTGLVLVTLTAIGRFEHWAAQRSACGEKSSSATSRSLSDQPQDPLE